jgi:hypothetical protein
LDEAAPDPYGNGVCAVAGAEFLHDVFDMDLYSMFRNEELVGNVAILAAVSDLLKNFHFARGWKLVAVMLG